jgi:CMP-N,N'-diacetyllegionaminic acid synthase
MMGRKDDRRKGRTVLGVIPARAGSKRIKGKNMALVQARPLIQYTFDCIRRAKALDHVLVSTDSKEVAALAEREGIDVPFMRPKVISGDTSTDREVLVHALKNSGLGKGPDAVVYLRPTAPLRDPATIDDAVRLFFERGCDVVRTVTRVKEHPYWMKVFKGEMIRPLMKGKDERSYPRSQVLPPVHRITGTVDVFSASHLMGHKDIYQGKVYGLEISEDEALDVDTPEDIRYLEYLLQKRQGDG